MSKKIEVTFSLCKLVLASCAYRRACYSEDDCLNLCGNSHFINFTATSLFSVAILKWCELFGSHTNEFHWKKSVVDIDGFKQKLFDSVGGEEKWIFVRNTFKVARDQAIAHVEDGGSRSIIPQRHLVNTASLLIEELKHITTDVVSADFAVSTYMKEKEREARRITGNTL